MANEFVARNGVIALRDSSISGSLFLHNNLYAPNNIGDFYISASGDDGLGTVGTNVRILAGNANSGASLGIGGELILSAGSGYTAFGAGQGGATTISAGSGNGTNSVGGDLNLVAGTGDPIGTGADGNINLNAHSGYISFLAPAVDLNTGGDLIWSANPFNYINLAGTGDSNISAYGPLNISLYDGIGVSGYNYKAIFRSSSLDLLTPLNVSGSASITGSLNVTQDITASNALFSGTITAQTIYAQVITSSTEYITGSTIFGSLLTNTHQFTGSVSITGSLNVAGLINGTSSFATTAATSSYPINVTGTTIYSTGPATSLINTTNNIFLGDNAGYSSSLATTDSNFFGYQAGYQAFRTNNSNFFGYQAGYLATGSIGNSFNSNFFGYQAGYQSYNARSSNFLGFRAGYQAPLAIASNFLGTFAGFQATNASYSNFLGQSAGQGATGATGANFLGNNAGNSAAGASESNFLGSSAGLSATNASDSNFLGYQAGYQASSAQQSNFIGSSAGFQATSAYSSNFLGPNAGVSATGANSSNFLGVQAGKNATNASNSNFLGQNAGFGTSGASYSNFLGYQAGSFATNASYSVLIGYQVGYNPGGLAIGSNNIIIGTNLTVPTSTANLINIGGLIFGSGSYSTTTGNPFSGSANGKIGINQPNPSYELDVSGSINFTSNLYQNGVLYVAFPYTGSAIITGSLVVTGSVTATTGFTGSLFGTASYATSASYAISASNATSASYAISASNATSASYALTIFPFTGSAIITGSLTTTGLSTFYNNSLKVTSTATIPYTPFTDDYNRATLSPGGTPSLTYTNTNTGTGNATIVTNYLNIVNGGTAGRSYTTVPISGFSSPYNPVLSSNDQTIEWTLNARTNRTTIFSGFGASQYGGAYVLCGSDSNLVSLGQGYAVVYGGDTFRNWRLVRYNNGLAGTLTNIVTAGANIFAGGSNYVSIRVTYNPSTNSWSLYFRDDGNIAWSNPAVGVTTLIGTTTDSTYTGTSMTTSGFLYNYSTAASQNLQFDNLTISSSYNPQPILNVSQSKVVGINTNTPIYALDVNASTVTGARIYSGSLAVGNITPSATVGRIDASNDVVAFSTSDERLKTNVTPIQDALNKVTQIGGYEFDWMLNPEVHDNKGHDVGVIAQEIEKILPEVVTTRDNGYKAVKYEKIVPLLIEAIKDLQQQINELKNK